MKQKEWVRSERRRLHRSERRLQILSAFALSGGESPFSKEKTWIDLVARMRHYFTLPVVLCHAPCMTCGNDTEPNVYGFGGVGAIGYGAKEKCLRRPERDRGACANFSVVGVGEYDHGSFRNEVYSF